MSNHTTPRTQALDIPAAIEHIRRDRARRVIGAFLAVSALVAATFVGEALVLAQDRTPVQSRGYDAQPGELAPYFAD